jgi:integrase
MKVTLREKVMAKGMTSLYLDIYDKGKRAKKSLDLKVYTKPSNQKERNHNKEVIMAAEAIASERYLDEVHQRAGLTERFAVKTKFLTYFRDLTEQRYSSKGNYDNWDSAYKILVSYCGANLTFSDINQDWVKAFRDYLDKEYKTKSNKPLSQNSKHSYFNKFKACFKEAIRDQIISRNPCEAVKGFKMDDLSNREILTIDEVRKLAQTACDPEVLKSAFLFGCMTGLRWSDVNGLKWDDIQQTSASEYIIRHKQKKTKSFETTYLNGQAIQLIAPIQKGDERVFKGLKYSAWTNLKLKTWVLKAGITKSITFHSSRHTFATLQLEAGTDIYTVSKLLAHKNVRTTEIYAKVLDKSKKDAVNKLPDIF